MKTIRFEKLKHLDRVYRTDEPGDHSGVYVRKEDVREEIWRLVEQLESASRWISPIQHDSRSGKDVYDAIQAAIASHTKGPTP